MCTENYPVCVRRCEPSCIYECAERVDLIPENALLDALRKGIRHPCVSDADLAAVIAEDYLTHSLHYRQWHTNGHGGGSALKLRKRQSEQNTAINLATKITWPVERLATDGTQLACIHNGDADRPLTLGELCGYSGV